MFARIQNPSVPSPARGPVTWYQWVVAPATGSSPPSGRTIQSTVPTRGPWSLPSGQTKVCFNSDGERLYPTPRYPRALSLGLVANTTWVENVWQRLDE